MLKLTALHLTALIFAPLAVLHAAEWKLPSIFSDHLVLQCDKAVPLWGWADAGSRTWSLTSGHRFGTETADDTAQGVRTILDTLATKAPAAKILLLAIFPWGSEAIKRQRNDEVNRQIKKLADNQKIFWLDLGEHFLDSDGALSKPLFKDEKPFTIHLTAEGYEA
jgi:lysophospholipase L1-like esterase